MTTPPRAVPRSVPSSSSLIEDVEDVVEDVIEDVETLFPYKPGGMIDRHMRERARREAAQKEAENQAQNVNEPATHAVKMAQVSPEIIKAQSIVIPPGGTAQILPNAPYRYRTTIITSQDAADSVKVVLSQDQGMALGGVGFSIPPNVPIVINSRAQLYAYNGTTNTHNAVISVLAEIYAPETIEP